MNDIVGGAVLHKKDRLAQNRRTMTSKLNIHITHYITSLPPTSIKNAKWINKLWCQSRCWNKLQRCAMQVVHPLLAIIDVEHKIGTIRTSIVSRHRCLHIYWHLLATNIARPLDSMATLYGIKCLYHYVFCLNSYTNLYIRIIISIMSMVWRRFKISHSQVDSTADYI